MRQLGVAVIGLALAVSTAARGQTLRDQLRDSGNPSGSTCPIRILSDYGKRVAAEEAAKAAPKPAWESGSANDVGARAGGQAKGWMPGGSAK